MEALSVSEICLLIARCLKPRDLCCLALVCRDWRDVAELVLWEELPDFGHLLRLLPRDLWSPVPKTSTWRPWESQSMLLTRALTPADWTPLLRKSQLVRRLIIVSYPASVVQEAILSCPPPADFLASVRSLRIESDAAGAHLTMSCKFLASIVSLPAITSLHICSISMAPNQLRLLLSSCFNLDELSVFSVLGYGVEREEDDNLLGLLADAGTRVSSLNISFLLSSKHLDVDERYLPPISVLPSVTKLFLYHVRSAPPQPISYSASSFMALRDLTTHKCPVETLVDIIRLGAGQLERIHSTFRHLDTLELQLLVEAIRVHCSPDVLRTLRLVSEVFSDNDYLAYLRPLSSFKQVDIQLQDTWHYDFGSTLEVCDADSASLA